MYSRKMGRPVEFEWDEGKRARILRERALDFASAYVFFDGRPVIHQPTPRGGEDRWKTVARIEGAYFTPVWMWRSKAIRVISMRRAHAQEIKVHRQTHGG